MDERCRATDPGVEVRLLGPVSLGAGGREITIRSPKQQVILAMLALSPRVSADAMADALWRDAPPASVAATVHTLVSRLRRTIEEAGGGIAIRSEGVGYVMDVDPSCVDVHRFEAHLAAGRSALAERSPEEAARWLRRALSLWRGPALEDVSDRDFARVAATRLEEARRRATEELAEAELASGRPAMALEALKPLMAVHPYDEGLRAREMVALYRLGRQADALAAFQDLRRCLAEELGLEPTPALCALERQILLQAPELDHVAPSMPSPGPVVPGDLPAGVTLAFLFTDIESSTRRWERERAAMTADLARHDEALHAVVVAHEGRLFTHLGDGLGAAFPTVTAALSAAVAGQEALAAIAWQGTTPLRVRMAIHVGSAETRAGTFLGPTLNRTARLLDEARGGEILCSQAAADLARDELPPQVTLAERGERRLRGLSRPEPVWQVIHPALADSTPPPPPCPSYQPAAVTSFVGRADELAALSALLPQTRLLTITGVGGVGKTRLALELAARCGSSYADGATVVELAPAGDDRPVAGVVLTALGLDAGGPAEERLERALAERHLLLVLDNCEHLLESVAGVADGIVRHCPSVSVLATSRQVLSLPGETVWIAPGLSLPSEDTTAPADLERSDAAALFVARARLAQPGFGVTTANAGPVAAICRRLDGLPLALELAAARVRVLGVAQLAEHLDDRFRLLTGGPRSAPYRHQTLVACMNWSYEALPEPEQRMLRRLAIFPQDFDLAAATAVAGEGSDPLEVLELLAHLIDKSLVVPEGAAQTARYRLLETVRQFGAQRLMEAGEEAKAAALHRLHFVGLVEQWHRRGENFFATAWLLGAATDRENFHRALVNAIEASDTEAVSILVAGLWNPWFFTGSIPSVVASIEPEMLACADPSLHAEALIGFSAVIKMSASTLTLDDLGLYHDRARAIADERGTRRDQGWARFWIGYTARDRGDVVQARAFMEEALSRFTEGHCAFELSFVHYDLGWVDMTAGDVAAARRHFRSGLAFAEAITGYEISTLVLRASLALAEAAEGDTATALDRARTTVETARRLPFHGLLVNTLVRAAETGAVAGFPARAELAEALRLIRYQGGRQWVAAALTVAALLHEGRATTVWRRASSAVPSLWRRTSARTPSPSRWWERWCKQRDVAWPTRWAPASRRRRPLGARHPCPACSKPPFKALTLDLRKEVSVRPPSRSDPPPAGPAGRASERDRAASFPGCRSPLRPVLLEQAV
jgi:predicted ATPase/DNA-binding SARP family transcriptional activator